MISALLMDACGDMLVSALGWTKRQVGIRPDGRPSSIPKDFFIGFFGNDVSNVNDTSPQTCHGYDIQFTARVSMLTRMTPKDNFEKLYFENVISIGRIVASVQKTLLDNRETIRASVNTALAAADEEYNTWMGLNRTYQWLQTQTELTERDNEWFHSTSKSHHEYNHAGYSLDIIFGKARVYIRSNQ